MHLLADRAARCSQGVVDVEAIAGEGDAASRASPSLSRSRLQIATSTLEAPACKDRYEERSEERSKNAWRPKGAPVQKALRKDCWKVRLPF
jgi:hypothetical protein